MGLIALIVIIILVVAGAIIMGILEDQKNS
jgi:hypothetical protein